MEPSAYCVLGKGGTAELHPSPFILFFTQKIYLCESPILHLVSDQLMHTAYVLNITAAANFVLLVYFHYILYMYIMYFCHTLFTLSPDPFLLPDSPTFMF